MAVGTCFVFYSLYFEQEFPEYHLSFPYLHLSLITEFH